MWTYLTITYQWIKIVLTIHFCWYAVVLTLALKCLSYFSLPFEHKGGPLGAIHFLVLFRRNFGTKFAPYVYPPKTTIYEQKERSKNVLFRNGDQKTNFRFAIKVTWPKFEKSLFRMNFSIKFGSKLKNVNTITFLK